MAVDLTKPEGATTIRLRRSHAQADVASLSAGCVPTDALSLEDMQASLQDLYSRRALPHTSVTAHCGNGRAFPIPCRLAVLPGIQTQMIYRIVHLWSVNR